MSVYMFADHPRGVVKIGTAANAKQRFRTIQSGYPWPLVMARVMDGDALLERRIHKRYAAQRLNGEWFNWLDEMLTIQPEDLAPVVKKREAMDAEAVIAAAGGSSSFARQIGIFGSDPCWSQKVANWKVRGIPAEVQLAHYGTIQRLRREAGTVDDARRREEG